MMSREIVLFVLYCSLRATCQTYREYSNNEKYGIIMTYKEYPERYICYKRLLLREDDPMWFSKLHVNIYFRLQLGCNISECIREAIFMCQFDPEKSHEIIVRIIYLLDYRYNRNENGLRVVLQRDREYFIANENNNLIFHEQILVNENTSGLFELINLQYNTDTSVLNEESFISLTRDGLIVGLFEDLSSPHYGWMKKDFIIRNKKYTAFINDFYCLSARNIKVALFVQLYNNKEKINNPCSPNGLEDVFFQIDDDKNCLKQPFVKHGTTYLGKYDFEVCNKLLTDIITNADTCVNNQHCNFSTIKEVLLGRNIKKISIYSDRFDIEEERKVDILITLRVHMGYYCNTYSSWSLSENIASSYCFKIQILYAILNHEKFIGDNVLVTFKTRVPSDVDTSWSYLLTDTYYGSILAGDEIIYEEKLELEGSTKLYTSEETVPPIHSISIYSESIIFPETLMSDLSSTSSKTPLSTFVFTTSTEAPLSIKTTDFGESSFIVVVSNAASIRDESVFSTAIVKYHYHWKKNKITIPLTAFKISVGLLGSIVGLSLIGWLLLIFFKYSIVYVHDPVRDL